MKQTLKWLLVLAFSAFLICGTMALCLMTSGCDSIRNARAEEKEASAKVTCGAMEFFNCFAEPSVQLVFGGINSDNCVERILNLETEIDPSQLASLREQSCLDVILPD
jgi:hypothetical protein